MVDFVPQPPCVKKKQREMQTNSNRLGLLRGALALKVNTPPTSSELRLCSTRILPYDKFNPMNGLFYSELYGNTALSLKAKTLLHSEQSQYQKLEIIDSYDWGKVLFLDEKLMITEKDEFFYHESITHLPLSFLAKPKKVLVIGGGDGGTARELLKYPSIEKIEVVEIDEAVVRLSQKYFPECACSFDSPRVQLFTEDALQFVQSAEQGSYDAILSDSTDPVGFAAGLIECDFYNQVRSLLTPEGLFCAQSGSPLSQFEELATATKNLGASFPFQGLAWSIVPTYPGALWSFSLASKLSLANRHFQHPLKTKFWGPAHREAMLTVPSFISEKLPNLVSL